jgi:hypothetical protein
LALVAIVCLGVAIANVDAGTDVGGRGWALRVAAVACLGGAILLNVLALERTTLPITVLLGRAQRARLACLGRVLLLAQGAVVR